jgi:cell division topological specificity factor
LEKLFGRKTNGANEAKERRKLGLIHDRSDFTAEAVESLKNDLIQVISRYVEIDPTAVRIAMNQERREQRLVADIPLRSAHRKRNIS